MRRNPHLSAGLDIKRLVEQVAGEPTVTDDVHRHMVDAKLQLEHFQREGTRLQANWPDHRAIWPDVLQFVQGFCMASQGLNMSIGGLHSKAFDDATMLLNEFVNHAEDLLAEAQQNEALPTADILNEILGVIERCNVRAEELTAKRKDINAYKRKITKLADP
jgi:hypothetical protein